MAEMENVSVGINVDIKRTDGRIHSAVVSGVNKDNLSVAVEWFEKGETKGKEIDLATLLQINPSLASNNNHSPERKRQPPAKSKSVAIAAPLQSNQNGIAGTAVVSRQQVVTRPTRSTVVPPPSYNRDTTMNGFSNEDENAAPGAKGQSKRKSVTVQEIERLKKNREERRAQQEELRKHKEELKNIDPGNPQWEFLGMIRDYRSKLEMRPLRVNDRIDDHQICVCMRKRPLNRKETGRKEADVVTVPNRDHMIVHQPQTKVDLTKYLENQKFRFDYTFDETSSNEMVYRFTAQPLVKTIFEAGVATCFAYGQTGSGKTHTMGGDFTGKVQDCAKGIYAMTARDVFKLLNSKEYKKESLVVSCSFFEIYSGKVFDLLNNKAKLRVLEDGKKEVQVVGLQEINVFNENDVFELIRKGTEARTAGQTSANNHSSRSHAVFQIILRRKSSAKQVYGKFSLIDLAGNERGADTMSSDRQTRMEGAEINKSLLALKECIRAMGKNSHHVPFRASKLTLVLRDSFIGSKARTCMIAMISPGLNSCEHTLNTLRYADRVKELGAEEGEGAARRRTVDYEEEEDYEMGGDSPNASDSDLALLQSRNEDELSNELYNFQLMINHVQVAEDKALEEHQRLCETLENWSKETRRLLRRTERVDYDIEAYAKDCKNALTQQRQQIVSGVDGFSAQIDKLLSQIQQEEVAAQAQKSTKRK